MTIPAITCCEIKKQKEREVRSISHKEMARKNVTSAPNIVMPPFFTEAH